MQSEEAAHLRTRKFCFLASLIRLRQPIMRLGVVRFQLYGLLQLALSPQKIVRIGIEDSELIMGSGHIGIAGQSKLKLRLDFAVRRRQGTRSMLAPQRKCVIVMRLSAGRMGQGEFSEPLPNFCRAFW